MEPVNIRLAWLPIFWRKTFGSPDAGLDVAIGAIGVWGGPVGWGIAGAYWLADEFVFDGNLAKGVSQWFRREEEYSQ